MSQKRKSSSDKNSTRLVSKNKSKNAKLFQTLATLQQTDDHATKRRKQSQLTSLQQSKAANDQAKLGALFLELRILLQRSFTCIDQSSLGDGEMVRSNDAVKEELDGLLENLLVARRQMFEHRLADGKDDERIDGAKGRTETNLDEGKKDYAKYYSDLIQKEGQGGNQGKDTDHDGDSDNETSSSDGDSSKSSSRSGEKESKDSALTLPDALNEEHDKLRSHWRSVLNRHHSNLQLHSGVMPTSSSKFNGSGSFKAVDVSFWEQVVGSMEHDKFRTMRKDTKANGNEEMHNDTKPVTANLSFDDSKLYQQMLKDFISSNASGANNANGKSAKRVGGFAMDPAQEAAERLKRAMRKKSGDSDVDLSSSLHSLLTSSANATGAMSAANGSSKKSTVDRRASKGRKIRYVVHPKLVNFTFPIARPEPMIPDDVWLRSLFGGVGNIGR